jgi:hypothetical protein
MEGQVFYRSAVLLVYIAISLQPVFAADPAPKFPTAVESIVSGMAGVVSATDQLNTLGRSVDRLHTIRTSIANTLSTHFSRSAELSFKLDNKTLLCDPRGEHAARAADRSYLSTVSSQITAVSTPGNIATLIDAIGVIFKHYSINVGEVPTPTEMKTKVIADCTNELDRFAASFYGKKPEATTAKDEAVEQLNAEEVKDIVSSISTLFDAINAIVNPLAKEFDRQQREYTVALFLFNNRNPITNSAVRLAKLSSSFGSIRKLNALGRFSEGMAVLRTQQIDLSKTDFCRTLPDGKNPFETKDDPQDSTKKISVPTDEFMSCYAAVWKQVVDVVIATLTAADEYDQFADAVKGDEVAKAQKISEQIAHLGELPKIDLKTLWGDAVRLVAFGRMLQDAFSKEHRDNVNSAIANLVRGL